MTLLIEAGADAARQWQRVLQARDPALDIRLYPEVGNAADITSLLSWKPPLGLLPQLPALRLLQCSGAGVDQLLDHPELPDCLARGVQVARLVDPGQAHDLAAYVLAVALGWYRRLDAYAGQAQQGQWHRLFPHPASARCRVGILGLGVMGRAIAQAFLACGFPVAGWAARRASLEGIETYAGRAELAAFADQCGVLVCALPLTPDTHGILDAALFSLLAPRACVVNVGRGGHLVEADLLAWLAQAPDAAAALDVHASEPLGADHPFWRHPRIRTTPHIGAFAAPERVAGQIVGNHHGVLSGQVPAHRIDLRRGY
ncbi:NAD(P)-dependent oxidoreductase [Burkholderia oklahomensis]|uniref:D-isomer specific 2-hydroxyacid dehydrogenase, NAD binding domain protein n=3 Tax=Burkholderia oklahomensis TaxID=342113 RepID=A0AAI8B4Z9_9BURK|nr:NAD(P)-dependent oxidoreductase [Burkholderia oklahomensis]AIO65762.1 D-isomer specific 2-hydroxyacid dehydrogenase, NAD binding domain protein [Burkholderia oklahomensis]AJX31587.1 D-isomer specific 2-hydroxyacid dehydrogenase, NAD binding domain protein [Burkholderia oklahomensis C6786]AOI42813.1 hydroxyacid dehydrogenase [Burkholderia oklahomensis EO147]AOI46302.1 hydroxyacid dehydrogenase [Burkholderia oklahomensis C6786]KUY53940.1 hydroxyacid dehydrogenase [Burkholderia oklahomensis C6